MKTLETKNAPAAIGPYSQAKMVGNFVFASGQIPVDPATGEVAGDKIRLRQSQLKNVGVSRRSLLRNVCKNILVVTWQISLHSWSLMRNTSNKPARSCVAVKQLPKNVLCEVEAIAVAE